MTSTTRLRRAAAGTVLGLCTTLLAFGPASAQEEEKVLNVYNWSVVSGSFDANRPQSQC